MAVKVESMAYEVLAILIKLVTSVHINAKAMVTIMTLTIRSFHIKAIEFVYPIIWGIGIGTGGGAGGPWPPDFVNSP